MAETPQPAAQLTLWKGALERVPAGKFLGLRGFLWVGRAGPCLPGPSVRWTYKQTAPDRTWPDSDEDTEGKHLTRCDAHSCWLPSSRGNPQGTLSSISDPGWVDGPVLSTGQRTTRAHGELRAHSSAGPSRHPNLRPLKATLTPSPTTPLPPPQAADAQSSPALLLTCTGTIASRPVSLVPPFHSLFFGQKPERAF